MTMQHHPETWPKPGERWSHKDGQPDILITPDWNNEKGKVCFYEIVPAKPDRCEDLKLEEDCDINSFMEIYEKSKLNLSDALTQQIDMGNTKMHLMINRDKTRLPRLVVQVENPKFPTCSMELHDENFTLSDPDLWNPLEFLAKQSRAGISENFFGADAKGPDFPKTVIYIEDIARDMALKRDFVIKMKKGMEDIGFNTLRTEIKKAMIEFDGDDNLSCENLAKSLSDNGLKDAKELILIVENPKITPFMDEVWMPMHAHLEKALENGLSPQFTPEQTTSPYQWF